MPKLAFIFPGQGTQYPGMMADICENFSEAAAIFNSADKLLGFKLSEIIFRGSKEDLTKTEITQPAILTSSMAIKAVLAKNGIKAQALAGLSLGEYSALVSSGALLFKDALPLVQKRGRIMQETLPENYGNMAAIIGIQRKTVEEVCRKISANFGEVTPANYNCPGQIVISGLKKPVQEAIKAFNKIGALRITMLNVNFPFHTSMMAPAGYKLQKELETIKIVRPRIPFISNVTAKVAEDPVQIKQLLVKQLCHPVMWEDTIKLLISEGFDTFMEIGPGKALTGFIKKASRKVSVYPVNNLEMLHNVVNLYSQ